MLVNIVCINGLPDAETVKTELNIDLFVRARKCCMRLYIFQTSASTANRLMTSSVETLSAAVSDAAVKSIESSMMNASAVVDSLMALDVSSLVSAVENIVAQIEATPTGPDYDSGAIYRLAQNSRQQAETAINATLLAAYVFCTVPTHRSRGFFCDNQSSSLTLI